MCTVCIYVDDILVDVMCYVDNINILVIIKMFLLTISMILWVVHVCSGGWKTQSSLCFLTANKFQIW